MLQLFDFADKYRGKYDSSITVAQKYYRSVSGYAVSYLKIYIQVLVNCIVQRYNLSISITSTNHCIISHIIDYGLVNNEYELVCILFVNKG